ncbi:MAG TPA: PVC-type heme-binding CxxCH protein [Pirellulales bacterium]|nr:PVC-type heme-binding CxxCH protein [Pirellulales bacterium]
MIRSLAVLASCMLVGCLFPSCAAGQAVEPTPAPPEPAEAAKNIRPAEGLEVRLFASEPMVRQPVSISFDHRGRLWVLQYIQYPNPNGLTPTAVDQYLRTKYDRLPEPPPRGPKGNDRITILEDSDGDGRADRATDFLDGLNLASGMALGYDGVFVAQPPYLLFYADRDHDDVPDGDPEVLLKGFGMEDAHAFANSLTWGPDGWLYGAQGSTVTADIRGVGFQQGIWRYHVPTRRFELFAEGGGNTWGIDFDRDGQLFAGGNTTEPLCHHVQGAYYIKGFGKHGPLHNPFAFGYFNPVKHVGFLGTALTGGCVIYQGGLFSDRFHEACIYPNLRANAMRVARLVPSGSTFETHYQEDFAASSDVWFRPVDCQVGPDGALYAADWCDVNISHTNPKDRSEWYPPSRNDGRIWRFVPAGTNPTPMAELALEHLASRDLVKLLPHRNAWYSREAWRILGERRDPSVLPELRASLFAQSASHIALESLWALYVSGGLSEDLAGELLKHPAPAVRAWTIRLIGDECLLPAAVQGNLLNLAATEADSTVRSQLACTARRLPGPQALAIVARMLRRDIDAGDPHLPLLLWWAIEDKAISDRSQVLELFAEPEMWVHPLARDTVAERLARRYAGEATSQGWDSCSRLQSLAPDSGTRDRLLAAVDAQLAGTRLDAPPPELSQLVESILRGDRVDLAVIRLALRLRLPEALPKGLAIVGDRSANMTNRVGLIEAIGTTAYPECVDPLLSCFSAEEPPAIRLAALSALQAYDDAKIAEQLMGQYARLTPELKTRIRGLLVSRAAWSQKLVNAVRNKQIPASDVEVEQVRQMLVHKQPDLNRQIESLWGRVTPATTREKQGKISAVSIILAKGKGDAAAGKPIMLKQCGICHQLFGEGNKIGPDLTTADRKNLAVLLPNVVDPSAVIRPEFLAYTVQTIDGRALSGLLAESTPDAITLLDAKNARTTINRMDIEAMEPMPSSLMPERILDALTDQQIRDLFEYLQSNAGTGDAQGGR